MRKAAAVALCAALFVTGLVAGGLVPAASQGATTLALCEKNGKGFEKGINEGRKGFSAGDWSVESTPLYNRSNGNKVGRDVSRFVLVKRLGKNNGLVIIDVTANVPGGKLTAYASTKFSAFRTGAPFAITGGTGKYAGASGVAKVRNGKCGGVNGIHIDITLQ
jgi:hypothetical protein